MDLNSFYTILNNIFGREQNENYTNRNRSAFAGGLADLRNGWAAMQNNRLNNARKEQWSKEHGGGNGNNGTIGGNATAPSDVGTFTMNNNGIDSMPSGYTMGSPIEANGTDYSFLARQGKDPNDYTFQNAMPTEQNGFHLGDYPQTEMYGDPKDWQRQMVRNAAGLNGESKWFNPSANGDNTMNIKDQNIGQNYNKRIDSQLDGVFPQSPNGFANAFGRYKQGTPIDSSNFYSPTSDNQTVQAESGAKSSYQQMIDALASSKYLGDQYTIPQWMADDRESGVTDPVISMLRYQTNVAPLVRQAREDRLRETFRIANDPNVDSDTRTQALAALSYELKNPDLVNSLQRKEDEFYAKQGMIRNPNYSDGDSEYGGDDENARAIYSHLASKGIPANVIAGIMGNLQAESGFNSSAVGDGGQSIGLAQWYDSRGNNLRNFAKQRGKEWNDVGTQLDFLLDEIQQSNPDLLQRMAKLSPHEAAILFHDEFERSADTPEMKARRGEYASNIFNGRRQNSKYVRDPNVMTKERLLGLKHKYNMEEIAARNGYRNKDNGSALDKQRLKAQQNFEKNTVGMRKSAMALAGLQNIDPNDEKSVGKYEKGMDDFAKQIEGLYDSYGLSENKMDSTRLGIELYHELNGTRSGLRPETLAEGVARAIYAKRGDVSPEELQRSILAEVYGNNSGGDTPLQVTGESKQEYGGGGSSGFADIMRDTRAYDDYNGPGVYNINDKRTLEPEPEDRYKYAYVRNLWQKGLENLERGRQIK